jgi:FixJ family two-component response regulator
MPKNKLLISIVDDDEAVREATKDLMRSLGFRAEAFPSGEDFLNSRYLSTTACLLTDVNMPGMTGLELHRRLMALGKNIPTIFITAYPCDSTRKRALAAGVKCYISKPFAEHDLLDCIGTALRDAG